MTENRIPIVYDGLVRVRFSDLDSYGHLSASHYVDIVGSSRLFILEDKSGITMAQLMEKGIGFYLKRTVINYHRPVKGLVHIRQQSYVSRIAGSEIEVAFKVLSEDQKKVHADGELHYFNVDISSGKPSLIQDWLLQYFFTDKELP